MQMDGLRDPSLLFTAAQAFAAADQVDMSLQCLARLLAQTPNNVQAQLLMVHLERQTGGSAHAEARLNRLVRNPETVTSILHALLRMRIHNEDARQLIQWADASVNIAILPQTLQQQWLWCRASVAAEKHDWPLVTSTLEQMIQSSNPDQVKVIAARVAVMIRLKKMDRARQIYRATPELAESRWGPLLAVALGVAPHHIHDQSPIARFLQSGGAARYGRRSWNCRSIAASCDTLRQRL